MLPVERLILGGAVGLSVGSFLNVLIHRVPRGETPWRPGRSYCPACRATIRGRDNIPIFSYLWLRGRCRQCGSRISPRYLAVEATTGVFFALACATANEISTLLHVLAFGMFLLTLGVIDAETTRLPNGLVGTGAGIGLVLKMWTSAIAGTVTPFWGALVAGAVGFCVLSFVRWVASWTFRQEAMGSGDPKFLGAIGIFLGKWQLVLLAIGLSAVTGSVVGGVLVLKRRSRETTRIPYGPFLALGAGIAALWGEKILDFYLGR